MNSVVYSEYYLISEWGVVNVMKYPIDDPAIRTVRDLKSWAASALVLRAPYEIVVLPHQREYGVLPDEVTMSDIAFGRYGRNTDVAPLAVHILDELTFVKKMSDAHLRKCLKERAAEYSRIGDPLLRRLNAFHVSPQSVERESGEWNMFKSFKLPQV
jgi:hypothetical protein